VGFLPASCQGLVKLGFLVLAFDPIGQGERIYYPDSTGVHTRLSGGSDGEHTVPGKQMLLVGATCSEFQLWDAVRSLDYLAQHRLADPSRLASTGQSGGATLTMLLAAVDDRIRLPQSSAATPRILPARTFFRQVPQTMPSRTLSGPARWASTGGTCCIRLLQSPC